MHTCGEIGFLKGLEKALISLTRIPKKLTRSHSPLSVLGFWQPGFFSRLQKTGLTQPHLTEIP